MKNVLSILSLLIFFNSCKSNYPCDKSISTVRIGINDNIYKDIDSITLSSKNINEVYYKTEPITINEAKDFCSHTCMYANGCSSFYNFYITYLVYKNKSKNKQILIANTYFGNYLDGGVFYDEYNVKIDTFDFVIPSFWNEEDRAYYEKYVYKEYVGDVVVNNKIIKDVYKVLLKGYPFRAISLFYGPDKKIVRLINPETSDTTDIY